jgi:hypothetical protein
MTWRSRHERRMRMSWWWFPERTLPAGIRVALAPTRKRIWLNPPRSVVSFDELVCDLAFLLTASEPELLRLRRYVNTTTGTRQSVCWDWH